MRVGRNGGDVPLIVPSRDHDHVVVRSHRSRPASSVGVFFATRYHRSRVMSYFWQEVFDKAECLAPRSLPLSTRLIDGPPTKVPSDAFRGTPCKNVTTGAEAAQQNEPKEDRSWTTTYFRRTIYPSTRS